MNLWFYLLSTICAHSCNFPTPQDMIMKMTGMRFIAMSTRFGVNQSTVSLCGASVESVVYFMLSFMYKTMWFIMFRYVINTAMVHLRFVYLCVRLFLRHIWVFYASYFVLKIWVWQVVITLDTVVWRSRTILKREEYFTFSSLSPTHVSSQNLVLVPSLTSKEPLASTSSLIRMRPL